jgi:hypothetical protein
MLPKLSIVFSNLNVQSTTIQNVDGRIDQDRNVHIGLIVCKHIFCTKAHIEHIVYKNIYCHKIIILMK